MRIHRLRIADFKGVESCEVEFDLSGVTIIEGDNESGKSTLLEALDLLFELRSDSKHRRVTATQPVGKDVGPTAEAELTVGDQRLTLRKRWIKNNETVLTIHGTPDRQVTGQEAHNTFQELLDNHVDRDLLTALRLAQGTELSQASMATRTLSGALDAAVGHDSAGTREDSLWEAIQAERSRYTTPTGAPNQERKKLNDDVNEAQARVEELTGKAAKLERDIASLAQLTEQIDGLEERDDEQRRLITELEQAVAGIRATRATLSEAEAELRTLQGELALATSRADARNTLVEQLTQREGALREATEALEAADSATADLAEREKALVAARDEADQHLQAAQTEADNASADHDLAEDLINLELLEERVEKHDRAQELLADAEETIDSLKIDDQLLADIEQAHERFLIATSSAEQQAVAVRIEAFEDVEITGADLDGRLAAGSVTETLVNDQVELVIPGQLRINLTPGHSAEDTRTRREAAEQERSRLLRQAGVSDVAAARIANGEKKQAEANRDERQEEITGLLRDLTPESMRAKVERLVTRVETARANRDPDRPPPASLDEAEEIHARAKEEVRRRQGVLERAETELEAFRSDQHQSQIHKAQLATQVEQARLEVESAKSNLESARNEAADDELRAAVQARSDAVGQAQVAVDDAIKLLKDLDAESTEVRFANARDALERTRNELADAQLEHAQASISLRLQGEEGIASEIDEAVRELERLTAERDRLEARAAAASLLYATFDRHRSLARERYAAPLRDEIERLGRLVFGEGVGVELDDDLRITGRQLDGRRVAFDQLSVGAQEQLGLLARLACASLVGGDGGEGAPVILDDALGWTDPGRVERMGTAISAASKHAQVIILTCTPKRYAAVGNASVIRLPSTA